MLPAILAVVAATELTLVADDDVWAYAHAQDQVSDPYLRAWGAEEGAVGEVGAVASGYSYSALKFVRPGQDGTLKAAKLVLTHAPEPGFEREDTEAHPIQVRALSAPFEEDSWEFEDSKDVHPLPGDDKVYGTGWAFPGDPTKPFTVEVDLMKGPNSFAVLWQATQPGQPISLALTTTLRPQGAGESMIYKFYSRSAEERHRPKLVLFFE